MSGERQKKGLWLDPRAKLFLILICVLASMFAPSLAYQFALVVLIAILGTFFGKWKYVIKAVCFYAVICVLTVWIMAEMTGTLRTMFIAFLGLFHKVYACGMLAGIVLSTTKVNEFLSAMNRVHAPKKLVIPLAVMLRYIPTIQEDWRYIKDAMRMRDVSPSLGGFLSGKIWRSRPPRRKRPWCCAWTCSAGRPRKTRRPQKRGGRAREGGAQWSGNGWSTGWRCAPAFGRKAFRRSSCPCFAA